MSHPTHEHVRHSSKESAVAFLQVISPHRNHYEIHTFSRGHGAEMKKSLLFIVSLSFILGFIGADAYASTPKAGTTCSKLGVISTSAGIKFKCIKSVSGLVWSKSKSVGEFVTPHPVDNKYGITWKNITSRVKDISAAAYTDAQATIARNQGLPSAASVFKTYISPGAKEIYPQVENSPNLMKRTFSLFAKYSHTKKVFYIATTMEEKEETFAKLDKLYPSDPFMKQSINDMYGIDTNQPKGSVFVRPTCGGMDTGRNTLDYRHLGAAAAVVWNFCPADAYHPHLQSDHGASHEYVHTIQIQTYQQHFLPGFQPCWMTEGEPEWTQTAVSSDFSEYISMQNFQPYYLTSTGLEFSVPTQTTWSAGEISAYLKEANVLPCNTTKKYALAYSAGAAAIEALVAIGGSESFFAVDQRIARGEKFVDAFKKVYGVTWSYAEPILSEVVAQKLTYVNSPEASTYQTRP